MQWFSNLTGGTPSQKAPVEFRVAGMKLVSSQNPPLHCCDSQIRPCVDVTRFSRASCVKIICKVP